MARRVSCKPFIANEGNLTGHSREDHIVIIRRYPVENTPRIVAALLDAVKKRMLV